MSVAEETGSAATPVRRWRRRLKRAAITLFVLVALLAGGLTYAFKVSGLEISTPNGVNVVIARKPLHGPPIEGADRAVHHQLRELAEANPNDFGYPGWDPNDQTIHVNIATERGEELYARLVLPSHDSPVKVRTGALSVATYGKISAVRLEGVYSGSYDARNGRALVFTNSLGGDLLGQIKELFGTDAVAVVWEPWVMNPPRSM